MLRRRSALRLRPALCAALAALVPAAAAAISGVCPDGSIFIVQSAAAIPCRDAKRVDPHDVPPLQPEYLPRPYGWEVFNQRSDPNNPYNVVGTPRPGADAAGTPPPPRERRAAPPPPVETGSSRLAAVPPRPAASPRALELSLSERELADLDEIVVLMQSVAPATVADFSDEGQRRLAVELARSSAFEQRVHAALARRGGAAGGPVVLFRAEAAAPAAFHGNLTFVQGHVAFHPEAGDPAQLGVLSGGLGELAPADRVLGYVVLPAYLDPAQPLDIYWNDRRITATLRP